MIHARAILEKDGVKYHFLWDSSDKTLSARIHITRQGKHNAQEDTREYNRITARTVWTSLIADGFVMAWKGEREIRSMVAMKLRALRRKRPHRKL